MLVDDIPLHMSVKIFSNSKEYDLEELKTFVRENEVYSPDPSTLTFIPIIFTAEKSKLDYYMLKIEGLGPQYKALYDHYDKVGNVYKKFMTHVTIDKPLYDDLKKNPLRSDEIEFSNLIVEHGAGNTVHDFQKSETLTLDIVKDMVFMDLELRKSYPQVLNLLGDDLRRFTEDNPELGKLVMEKHEQKLAFRRKTGI